MSVGLYSHTTRGTGTVLTAAIYNADHVNHITNQNPTMTGALADNVAQYQTNVDPGGIGSESLPTNLAGELERLRFCIKRLTGKAQWYAAPSANMDQTLNSVSAGEIAISGATPFSLRRTENDAVEREILKLGSGSGAGSLASWRILGGGANNVVDLALYLNNVEQIRFSSNIRTQYPAQGYLTPTAGVPIILADAVAATSVVYEPFLGCLLPVMRNGVPIMRVFGALTLTLDNPNHAAATLYDVFAWEDALTLRIVTGPAWSNSGAGTSTRGVGAGTTELMRSGNGMLLNNVSMTARNGTSTFTVPAQLATYLGTILIDAVGTVTCHRSIGQDRKWGVWNAYNRLPVYLKATDPTANWSYSVNTVRASNGDSNNKITVLSGLAEEIHDIRFGQLLVYQPGQSQSVLMRIGIGINSTTVMSGRTAQVSSTAGAAVNAAMLIQTPVVAEHKMPPSLGINNIQSLEITPDADNINTYHGTEANMMLSARWEA